uniref:Uncharacterized protein n=1 Tax=Rhabditophanes sp. KR3021 TaxID=114890 RepID=A0AC35TZ78_9BILA
MEKANVDGEKAGAEGDSHSVADFKTETELQQHIVQKLLLISTEFEKILSFSAHLAWDESFTTAIENAFFGLMENRNEADDEQS